MTFVAAHSLPALKGQVSVLTNQMNLDEYKASAASTAVYPGAGQRTLLGLSYLALGLVGEVSEIAELVELRLVGKAPHPGDICHELGDVLWYDAMLTHDLGIVVDTDTLVGATIGDSAQQVVDLSDLTVVLLILALVAAAGQVAETLKKAIRAESEVPLEKVGSALCDVRRHVAALGIYFGFSIEKIRAANIAKLAARFASDTIKVHA